MDVVTAFACAVVFLAAWLLLRHVLEQARLENLERRPVFITGCDSGFGRALAIKCLHEGMPVIAGCLTKEGADSIKEEASDDRLDVILVDITSEKSVADAKEFLERKCEPFGGLHALVNNAGVSGAPAPDDWLGIDDYKRCVEVNTFGHIRVTHALKPLVKQARGRIVTVASICGRVALAGSGPYVVSKFAIEAYCDVIRQELEPFGVSVHILEPGFFNTPLANGDAITAMFERLWHRCTPDLKAEYGVEYFTKVKEKLPEIMSKTGSNRIDFVVDAYFHAITAKQPRSRYHVGYDSIFFFIPISLLPTDILDSVLHFGKRMAGLPDPDAAKSIAIAKKKL